MGGFNPFEPYASCLWYAASHLKQLLDKWVGHISLVVTDLLFKIKAEGTFENPRSISLVFCDAFLTFVNSLL